MNLIELALTTYTESNAERADTEDDMAREARAEFLRHARASATTNLCEAAAALDWRYVTDNLPDDVEEARALLDPVRTEYLRYRVDNAREIAALELVQPCAACRTDRISAVTSLFQLGQLLNEEQSHVQEPDRNADQEPGPLAALEQLENTTARVARLARRLTAEHPDAGLTVRFVSLYENEHGSGEPEIQLRAENVDAVRQVAAALGAEVKLHRSEARYGTAIEHADASATYDGIKVDLTGYRTLTADETEALLAEQNQAAETSAGGEG
ncbi:hypothetical protein [Streptomyces sp. NPDC006285]|uniref:hypothetical protein n=1 Tax=Streptomyces sp. NPDC006285 TaxID=3364742 RepID=UPI00368FB8F0